MVFNVISVLVGVGGVVYLCFLITIYSPAELFCGDGRWGDLVPTEQERDSCLWRIHMLDVRSSSQSRRHGRWRAVEK